MHGRRLRATGSRTCCQERFVGANCGSQCLQPLLDPARLTRTVSADGRLFIRLPQTGPDTGFVPGGQGVAGSNPAVPTGSEVLSNIFIPHESQQKEPSPCDMTLPEACADHVPRCPTRAFIKCGRADEAGSQGVKDRRATLGTARRPHQLPTAMQASTAASPAEVLQWERDARFTHIGHGYLCQHRIGCEIPQGHPGHGSRPRRTRPSRRRYVLLAMNPWPWPELSE